MIRIDTLLIEEFRGIRKLSLDFGGKNFAVCGRNGTGKSGVVDAIEFVLTGNISRLSGEGSDRLSVRSHAPHVDSRNNPERARVSITATIPSLKKTVTVVRTVSRASTPTVSPPDQDVLTVLRQIKEHPELVLTRREIIRYILATDGDRAAEVQAVLKLDRLESVRSDLRAIANAATRASKDASQNVIFATQSLIRALGISKLAEAELLAAVNAQRGILGLGQLTALTPTMSLKDGIGAPAVGPAAPRISKAAATQDVAAFRSRAAEVSGAASDPRFAAALEACGSLAKDPEALRGLARNTFFQSGLSFLDENKCPFCDKEWEPEVLRAHVEAKIKALEAARAKKAVAERALEPVAALLAQYSQATEAVSRYCPLVSPPIPSDPLLAVKNALQAAGTTLRQVLPLPTTIDILRNPPPLSPEAAEAVTALENHVRALPEPSREDAAREYLIVAQERLEAYREARRAQRRTESQANLATTVLDTYCKTSDAALTRLYKDVEKNFAAMYGDLNAPDEADFTAKLTPSLGKLGFDVNFYGKGFFPPGAYHSEGHQDAMGLCLYLALMQHVLKNNFLFAVLDDVLMSVDAGHRRAVCGLLRQRFPNTQFILTTHDPVWLNHMRTEGLIGTRALIHFHSWDVSTGPAFWDDVDVWDQIRSELKNDRVRVAAELLRNYLEYVSAEICHRLRARVEFRLDGRMELSELLPPAYERFVALLSKGKDAANSWGNVEARKVLEQRHDVLKSAKNDTSFDQWQVNAAVHYNAWASLERADFEPLVDAFQRLIDAFRCPDAGCQSFLRVLRDGVSEKSVDCMCGRSNFNLLAKPKGG